MTIEPIGTDLSLIDTVRFMSNLVDEVREAKIKDHILELDLKHLSHANSELVAQFVIMQSELVKLDGRLKIITANPNLKSAFDVVMLDKVIQITYEDKGSQQLETKLTKKDRLTQPKKDLNEFLIVALDFSEMEKALDLVDRLDECVIFYKVGMELFYRSHQKILESLKKRRKKIFLDLKINDIPQTIHRTISVLADLEVDYLTLFTDFEGMRRASETLDGLSRKNRMKLFNVTVLTTESKTQTGSKVLERSKMTLDAGGDGIICSGFETRRVKNEVSKELLIINPGVRPQDKSFDDQKRVVTPKEAFLAGADHIVMGRPVHRSKDPLDVVEKIFNEIFP